MSKMATVVVGCGTQRDVDNVAGCEDKGREEENVR
jgi:hypothetical protein